MLVGRKGSFWGVGSISQMVQQIPTDMSCCCFCWCDEGSGKPVLCCGGSELVLGPRTYSERKKHHLRLTSLTLSFVVEVKKQTEEEKLSDPQYLLTFFFLLPSSPQLLLLLLNTHKYI